MKNIPQDDFQVRRAKRRKKIRRRRTIIGLVFFLCLAIAVFVVLSLTILFPVKKVTVSGESRYTNEQIINACGLGEDDNIFTFSAERTMEQIRKNLPYIGEMTIERNIPDTVDIEIKSEHSEFAYYFVNGHYYVVSEDHFVLNSYYECPQSLIYIDCADVDCTVGEYVVFPDSKTKDAAILLVDELVDKNIKINQVIIKGSASLNAVVEDRFSVYFGGAINIKEKVANLEKTILDVGPSESGKINLSVWNEDNKNNIFIPGDIVIESPQNEKNDDLSTENDVEKENINELE